MESGFPHRTRATPMDELGAGIEFWRTRPLWPADFHNAEYRVWATENVEGDFADSWWIPFRRRLNDWIAIRPATYADVTERFVARREALVEAWATSCVPCRPLDITEVSWEQIAPFVELVGEIKPMKTVPSPVFTSKFCHFLLPKVFPVVDNEGSGNRWPRYEQYFTHVQAVWAGTPEDTRVELETAMAAAVTKGGAPVNPEFPMVNKIVELRLIGRQHPASR